LKRVRNKTNEWEVVDAMEDICNLWNFKVYAYPPPKMREGCDALIRDYEEEIEWAIAHRNELDEDVEDYICTTTIKACMDLQMPKD
jgi:hypothetical protein